MHMTLYEQTLHYLNNKIGLKHDGQNKINQIY